MSYIKIASTLNDGHMSNRNIVTFVKRPLFFMESCGILTECGAWPVKLCVWLKIIF